VCGFDGSTVSPADAAVALRSYLRRYRSVVARPKDQEFDAGDPALRPGASGWSAAAHALWATMGINAATEALHQVLVHDNPDISVPSLDPASPPPVDEDTEAILDRLSLAAESLAVATDNATASQWKRVGRTSAGDELSALDLVRTAVHQGIHHLRAAEKVMREVVGKP
jgi:hypothetical protein